MRGKPAGSSVTLSPFHWHGEGDPEEGDWLCTAAGSQYLVEQAIELGPGRCGTEGCPTEVRRFRLLCTKLAPSDRPGDGTRVIELEWHTRRRRRP